MYKGYEIHEVILKDMEHPQTEVILEASCGCSLCERMGAVQPGHELCGLTPDDLKNDDWVFPILDSLRGWILVWRGPDKFVDEWLDL